MNRYLLCYKVAAPHSSGNWSDGHIITSLPALTESALERVAQDCIAAAQKQAPGRELTTLVWVSCTKLDAE